MIGEFFDPSEVRKLEKTGKFAEYVAESSKRLRKFVDNANKKWGSGAIQGQDPESLVRFITSGSGTWMTPAGKKASAAISKIKYVKNMTAKHPEAFARLQNDFTEQLHQSIINPKTQQIDPSKIVKWTRDADNIKIVKEMMGAKYVKDLQSIAEVSVILGKPMKELAAEQAARGWIQSVRAAVAPPLTARGRAFTAGVTFYGAAGKKRLARAVLDPKTIAQVAELAEHSHITRQVAEKAMSLGYMLPGSGDPIPGIGAEE